MIIAIVAISENYAIGKGGKLPWHYSADMKFFKATTTGNAVVMGATTWRSIGKPLPDRTNVVLSHSGEVDVPEGVIVLRDKSEVVTFAGKFDGDTFIIGGAAVYASLADVIDEWLVTHIPETVADADTFMSQDFLDDFVTAEIKDLGDDLHVSVMRRK